jgi:hypothetical protein
MDEKTQAIRKEDLNLKNKKSTLGFFSCCNLSPTLWFSFVHDKFSGEQCYQHTLGWTHSNTLILIGLLSKKSTQFSLFLNIFKKVTNSKKCVGVCPF